jgi:hypothetical protein
VSCPDCNDTGLFKGGEFRCLCEKQRAWETDMNDRNLQIGDVVMSFMPTYGGVWPGRRMPTLYEITEIGPVCTCPPYLVSINNMDREIPPWPEHYHVAGKHPYSKAKGWLGAHLMDGSNVHSMDPKDHYLLIVGERVRHPVSHQDGFQLGLFA